MHSINYVLANKKGIKGLLAPAASYKAELVSLGKQTNETNLGCECVVIQLTVTLYKDANVLICFFTT